MAEVVRMPKMSDTMTEGVIVAWHKKVGDPVKPGDVLAEIETDKAVMEFESFQAGTLLYIGAQKGATVKVEDVIAILGKQGEDYAALLQPAGASEPPAAPAKDTKKESEKKVAPPPPISKVPVAKHENQAGGSTPSGRIKASPLAKKIAGESSIPLDKIHGTGDEGRIIRRDVENFITSKPGYAAPAALTGVESYDEVPVSQMRKTIARRLGESKFSAPHFYLTSHINMDRCVDLRTQVNQLHPDQKISFNDIVIKATALALRQNPKVNASWLDDRIRYNHHIHIGMAVAVDDGLLVPVIRFADQKSFSQINAEAKSLAAKAKEKKLQPDEMTGNTFSISNLGMMDIDEFTAIINPPDACILAIGRISKQAVVVKDEIKPASIMKVTLSCDHRVVDGATGAKFLQTLKEYLEFPLNMLF